MEIKRKRLLIIEDDREYLYSLGVALGRDYHVSMASTVNEAQEQFSADVDLVLLDVVLQRNDAKNRDGIAMLESFRQVRPSLPVVVMTAYGDMELAVDAMKLGASDFIQKEKVDVREIRKVLENALKRAALEIRLIQLEEDLRRLEPWELIGDSREINEVRQIVDEVAQDAHCAVLIRGEPGTGKELVARAIHSRGARAEFPFVCRSLSTLNPDELEKILFGTEQNETTGSASVSIGLVEKTINGIVSFESIEKSPICLNDKLLRLVETSRFSRVGGVAEVDANVQVICSTSQIESDTENQTSLLTALVSRLKPIEIRLPPLRGRTGDITLLADHFLNLFRQQQRTRLAGIEPAALECLTAYQYPGNVRELKSILERAMLISESNRHRLVGLDDLPLDVRNGSVTERLHPGNNVGDQGFSLLEWLARRELECIETALTTNERNSWSLLGLEGQDAVLARINAIALVFPKLMSQFASVTAFRQRS